MDKIIYFGGLGLCVGFRKVYARFYSLFLKKKNPHRCGPLVHGSSIAKAGNLVK